MSMSSHVLGIVPPDVKWVQMKKVWDSCRQAGVDPPKAVMDFFNHEEPDDKGVLIDLERFDPKLQDWVLQDWQVETCEGYEVHVERLLKKYPNIKIIRFYNSY